MTASAFFVLAPVSTDPAPRVEALQAAARLAQRQSDFPDAQASVEAALATSRETGDPPAVASLLVFLGDLAKDQGQADRAQALYQDGLSILRGLGDQKATAAALHRLAK